MTAGRLWALVRKELLDVARNRVVLLPVALVALISLVLPFVLAVIIPSMTGHHLGDDQDLVKVSLAAGPHSELSVDGRVQWFLFEQFLLVFLLIPITGAMALAAHAVVSEKLARTLEPLLATPLTSTELLVGKLIGALLPTFAISAAGLLVYFVCIGMFADSGVLRAILNLRSAVLLGLVGPSVALVSLQLALVVSSRVNDPRTAQQFGVLLILPITALLVRQFTGAMWLSAGRIALIGLCLLGVWMLLALLSVVLFDREAILTRWR